MNKILALALGLTVAGISTANATVFRVNNTPGSAATLTTIQDAYNLAQDNDTIYVEGSSTTYAGITVTRPIVIIGNGYFLTTAQQVNSDPATIGTITFGTGSAGSKIMGVTASTINVRDSNITVRRVKDATVQLGATTAATSINDALITQCYNITVSHHTGPVSGVIIHNNYIWSLNINTTAITDLLVYNNVISNTLHARNGAIYNNILRSGSFNAENCSFSYNICPGDQLSGTNPGSNSFGNNILNVPMNSIFETSFSNDKQYMLKPAPNVALGAGINGENLGMYGGTQPYVVSGIPGIPAVYYLNTSGVGNNTTPLNVTVKMRSHN